MPNENIDRAIKKGTGELEGGILRRGDVRGVRARRRRASSSRPPPTTRTAPWPRSGTRSAGTAATSAPPIRWRGCSIARARSTRRQPARRGHAPWRRPSRPAPRISPRRRPVHRLHGADRLPRRCRTRSGRRRARSSAPSWRMVPKNTVKVEGADAERAPQADGSARRARRRLEGLLQLRHRRRAAGGGGDLTGSSRESARRGPGNRRYRVRRRRQRRPAHRVRLVECGVLRTPARGSAAHPPPSHP